MSQKEINIMDAVCDFSYLKSDAGSKKLITMTELLKKAIAKIKNLPDSQQDIMAAIILEELEDETKWEQALANSQDMLAGLGAEAMQEYQAGATEELDTERL